MLERKGLNYRFNSMADKLRAYAGEPPVSQKNVARPSESDARKPGDALMDLAVQIVKIQRAAFELGAKLTGGRRQVLSR